MKVFITTSGTGSRLGDLTKYTNKSMVKIGKKPAISYIIEQYPKEFEFVISLGYFGDHTKQFLEMAYPDRKFTFVWVDKYEGEGSSQVYSQLCAKDVLQEPFIYNDCDTLVDNLQEEIPMKFDYNFLVGYKTNSELYDSFDYDSTSKKKGKFKSYKLTNLYSKHESADAMLSYIGIAGIYDYKTFWKFLETARDNDDWKKLSDFYVYRKYNMFDDLRAIEVTNWTDTGSIQGVADARKNCKDKLDILDKNDQAIFMIDRCDGKKVIKFFAKDGIVDRIVKHGENLGEAVHPIIAHTTNCLMYDYIEGELSINEMNPSKFRRLLNYFFEKGLWHVSPKVSDLGEFKSNQHAFYVNKTIERVERFKKTYGIKEDHDIYVNDIKIPAKYTIEYMLAEMEKMPEYKNATYTTWHGDFTLDNIMEINSNKWVGIDWRDSFGKENIYGDMLYDFGKMNHNLTLNFSSVYKNLFTVTEEEKDHIHVSILTNNYVYDCKKILKEFVENKGINYEFINFMSGLCWVNMSPLHFDPFTKFLFYMGKLTMYTSLKNYLNEPYE